MAYTNYKYCLVCEEERQHVNDNCCVCYERKHREEVAAWKAKTIDEKLLDIHKRLLRIEAGKTVY